MKWFIRVTESDHKAVQWLWVMQECNSVVNQGLPADYGLPLIDATQNPQ